MSLLGTRVFLCPVAPADGEEFVALARDSVDPHRGLIFAPTGADEFGYVAEAMRLAVRYAFEELGLARLDAHVQPGHTAFRKLLAEAGFLPVPADQMTIHIAGEAREHMRWTLTSGSDDPVGGP